MAEIEQSPQRGLWEKLIDAIIKKWFCTHDWKYIHKDDVEDIFGGRYTMYHFFCQKCGKYKRIKSF